MNQAAPYILAAFLALTTGALAQVEVGPSELAAPVLVTAAGQSADGVVLNALLRRAQVAVELSNLAEPTELEGVGTLIIALGASQKALGAAGIDASEELARIERLLSEANARGIVVVGVHIGGEGRRGPLSQPYLDAVSGRVDLLIVTEEGNADRYFDDVAALQGVSLTVLPSVNDVAAHIAALVN